MTEPVVVTTITVVLSDAPLTILKADGGNVLVSPNRLHITVRDGAFDRVSVESNPDVGDVDITAWQVFTSDNFDGDVPTQDPAPDWVADTVSHILDKTGF